MLEFLNTSITVAAGAHNPSILHPSFLTAQCIVPSDWELSEAPLCTPALSVVKFANGIVITVDTQRLQVFDNAPNDPRQSQVPGIVERYTETLPHVRYTGVGTNLSAFVQTDEADATLRRFLARGPWNDETLTPQSVGVRFVYHVLASQLRLSIDAGTIQPMNVAGAPRAGIVIAGNYHNDVGEQDPVADISVAARRFSDYCEHFREAVSVILHLQSQHAAN